MTAQERHSLPLDEKVDRAMKEAVAEAIETHRRLGQPIAILRDGQVVWIPASEIPTQYDIHQQFNNSTSTSKI